MRHLCTSLAFALLAAVPSVAVAQTRVPLDEFSAFRFTPAVGPNNYLGVDGADVADHLTPQVGLTLDYALRPCSILEAGCAADDVNDCEVKDSRADVVAHSAAAQLHGVIGLFDRLQVGLTVPLVFASGEGFTFTPVDGSAPV